MDENNDLFKEESPRSRKFCPNSQQRLMCSGVVHVGKWGSRPGGLAALKVDRYS